MTPLLQTGTIRQKVVRVAMLSVAVALALSMVGATLYEILSFRSSTQRELSMLADVIGANSTAALAFHDAKAGEETLATLQQDPRVESAVLLDVEGRSFVRYGVPARASSRLESARGLSRYVVSRPILLDGQRIGTITLSANLGNVGSRLARYGILMVLVAAGSFLTAFLLSTRLQRLISEPIRDLARTATAISAQRDYSLRVPRSSDGEVGLLIDRFNEMLAQIESRDRALESGRELLEERVIERTLELEHQVAERTRAEGDLAVKAEELGRSNTDLQQFAYVASHDLQEPLRMVASYLQLLSRRYQGKLDSNADEFINFAVDGARRMQALIQDLLAYSRVGTHAKPFELVDTRLIAARALGNLKVAIEESGALVTCDPLPTLWADPTQISQLFQNLIGNAIKFRGNRIPEIHVSAHQGPRGWTFSVKDNGIGIEKQYADRIFIIFQRLHTREEYGGTGIGLAVCKKIVERHQGRIWLESVMGSGATFHFTIETHGPGEPAAIRAA